MQGQGNSDEQGVLEHSQGTENVLKAKVRIGVRLNGRLDALHLLSQLSGLLSDLGC